MTAIQTDLFVATPIGKRKSVTTTKLLLHRKRKFLI